MDRLTLTQKQLTALELMSHGHTAKQAAAYAGVSEHTMKTHWAAVRLKLGVHHNYQAVGEAFRKGILE